MFLLSAALCGAKALVFASEPGAASDPSPPVEIPVTVLDRTSPSSDLGPSDLTLQLDGKEISIRDIRKSGPFDTRTAATPSVARRRVLFLFDLSEASPALEKARTAAREIARTGLSRDDLAGVASFSLERGLTIELAFTPDRRQWWAALASVGSGPPAESHDRLALVHSLDPTSPPLVSDAGSSVAPKSPAPGARAAALQRALAVLARDLDAVEGRKIVAFFTKGFEAGLLRSRLAPPGAVSEAEKDIVGNFGKVNDNASLEAFSHSTEKSTEGRGIRDDMFSRGGRRDPTISLPGLFSRSDCIVTAISLGENSGSADEKAFAGPSELAAATGGQAFRDTEAFSRGFPEWMERNPVDFIVSFSPPNPATPGRFHPLRLAGRKDGPRVAARSGYFEPAPAGSPTARSLSAADAIAAEIPKDALKVSLFPFPLPGEGRARVPVLISVSAGPRASPGERFPFELYLYAVSPGGEIEDFASLRAVIDPEKAGEALAREGVTVFASLRLSAGEFRLRALARNGASGEMGLAMETLVVPPSKASAPELLPPLFVGPESRGLMLRATSARAPAGDAYPFTTERSFLPLSSPEFSPGADIPLCLYAYGLGTPGSSPPVRIWGEILNAEDRRVGDATLVAGPHDPADPAGRSTMLVTLKTGGLAPGRYKIRIGLHLSGTAPVFAASVFRLV